MCVTFAPLIVVARTRFVLALASAHSSRTVFDVVVLLRDFFSHPISIVRASSTYCVSDVSISRAIRDRVSPPSSLGTMSTTALALGSPPPAISVPNRLDVHHHPRRPLDAFTARAPSSRPSSSIAAVARALALALAAVPRVDRASSASSSEIIAFAFGGRVASTSPPISTSRHDAHGGVAIRVASSRARRPPRARRRRRRLTTTPDGREKIGRGPCDGLGLTNQNASRTVARPKRVDAGRGGTPTRDGDRARRERIARANERTRERTRASVGESARERERRARAGGLERARLLELRNDAFCERRVLVERGARARDLRARARA
jgi:hypothetical protein